MSVCSCDVSYYVRKLWKWDQIVVWNQNFAFNVLHHKIQRLKLNHICVCKHIQVWMHFRCLYLHVCAWRYRTCVPLEACAPLRAAYNIVGVCIAGFEERVRARLVPVKVEALDLRLVQLDIEICVQSGEHPAQRVLTNRWCPDLKLCREKGYKLREGRCSQWNNDCDTAWSTVVFSTLLMPRDLLFFSGFWILTLLWLPFSCSTLNQSLRRLTTSFRSDSLHTEEQ